MSIAKIGRNDPCPCGALKPDGTPVKYKRCCELKKPSPLSDEAVKELLQKMPPPEPFEKGGFLTGRPFISEVFQGFRMRAVKNVIYRRPVDETFHMFLFRRFFDTLTQKWIEAEEKKESPHELVRWSREAQAVITAASDPTHPPGELRQAVLTGNMRALLALAYDFYSLQHCSAEVLPKLLNRLRDPREFQGARYEIAVAALACRAGFDIKWASDGADKHCEFTGTHKVTGERAAFEVKSHHRKGVLGREGSFDADHARVKIMDHVKEAVEQVPADDIPLVIFDDLNLPLSSGDANQKKWFGEVQEQLEKYGFFNSGDYKRCAALFITNFSWHFHTELPPAQNEVQVYFRQGDRYSLRLDTIMTYLDAAAKQYGHVPALQHEFQSPVANPPQ